MTDRAEIETPSNFALFLATHRCQQMKIGRTTETISRLHVPIVIHRNTLVRIVFPHDMYRSNSAAKWLQTDRPEWEDGIESHKNDVGKNCTRSRLEDPADALTLHLAGRRTKNSARVLLKTPHILLLSHVQVETDRWAWWIYPIFKDPSKQEVKFRSTLWQQSNSCAWAYVPSRRKQEKKYTLPCRSTPLYLIDVSSSPTWNKKEKKKE